MPLKVPFGAKTVASTKLLLRDDRDWLGPQLQRAFTIDPTPSFEDLIDAVDAAHRNARTLKGSEDERGCRLQISK